ncbi:MAG: hypothetical protein L0Y79_03740, partial [Chlorobi bacterium]|nr:hypothetical protein [Chlorobiota bacterium]
VIVMELGRPAANQELLVAAFQEQRWRRRIDNPFPGPHRKAREALRRAKKKLNHNQNVIRFRLDGTGKGIRCEFA